MTGKQPMDLRTYRAWSLQDALQLVRDDLGPEAAVLHTRKAAIGLWGWFGVQQVEVVAAIDADIPSRLPQDAGDSPRSGKIRPMVQPAELEDYRTRLRQRLRDLAAQGTQATQFIRTVR
jgi:flagellar biosynthesis GTPase FlhF